MRNNESIKDKIVNNLLFIKNWIRFKVFKVNNIGLEEPNTLNMKMSFHDDFKILDEKRWRIGQPWGLFHPDSPYQYYGDNAISIKEGLVLSQFWSPEEFTLDNKTVDIAYSVGLISSIGSFGYGFYKFEVKLPKGVGLWPAVWLSCVDSWPPEIDILEGYSDTNSDYKNNLQSNFHYDFDKNKKSAGARNHPVYSNDDRLQLSCWWTKEFINIYYNGYLVRQITNKNILNFFTDKKMIIILNNAVRPEYKDKPELIHQTSKFIVYNVSYWSNE